jgi:hypothetical protein
VTLDKDQPVWRLLLAAASVGMPLLVTGLIFFGIGGAFPAALPDPLPHPGFLTAGTTLAPAALSSVNAVLISSAAMVAVCLGVILWSLTKIWAGLGRTFGLLGAMVVFGAGAVFVATPNNPLIGALVKTPVATAVEAKVWAAAEFGMAADHTLLVGLFIGPSAIVALLIRFVLLCLRPAGTTGSDDPQRLAHRANELRAAILLGSAMLTAATLATYFYYRFPVALMTDPSAAAFDALSSQAAIRWGAAYTLALACAAAPAIAAFVAERDALARAPEVNAEALPGLFHTPHLTDRLRQMATAAAVLAPAGIVPVLEAVTTLFSG